MRPIRPECILTLHWGAQIDKKNARNENLQNLNYTISVPTTLFRTALHRRYTRSNTDVKGGGGNLATRRQNTCKTTETNKERIWLQMPYSDTQCTTVLRRSLQSNCQTVSRYARKCTFIYADNKRKALRIVVVFLYSSSRTKSVSFSLWPAIVSFNPFATPCASVMK